MVKYIHICIIFFIRDKLMWSTLALIIYNKLTLAFVAKLWCRSEFLLFNILFKVEVGIGVAK